jgi:hypothetical protein
MRSSDVPTLTEIRRSESLGTKLNTSLCGFSVDFLFCMTRTGRTAQPIQKPLPFGVSSKKII